MIKELLKEMSDEDLMELDRLLASAENALKQRRPMTQEEIIQGVTVDTSDDFHAGYWAGIRWAERHHGIKE